MNAKYFRYLGFLVARELERAGYDTSVHQRAPWLAHYRSRLRRRERIRNVVEVVACCVIGYGTVTALVWPSL